MVEYKKYFKRVDGFHSVSIDLKNVLNEIGKTNKPVKVIILAVSDNLFNISKNGWNFSNQKTLKKLYLLEVIDGKKGFTYALDAMKILKDINFNFHYTIIAPGKDSENLNYQISNLGLKKSITYISGLEHKSVIKKKK